MCDDVVIPTFQTADLDMSCPLSIFVNSISGPLDMLFYQSPSLTSELVFLLIRFTLKINFIDNGTGHLGVGPQGDSLQEIRLCQHVVECEYSTWLTKHSPN